MFKKIRDSWDKLIRENNDFPAYEAEINKLFEEKKRELENHFKLQDDLQFTFDKLIENLNIRLNEVEIMIQKYRDIFVNIINKDLQNAFLDNVIRLEKTADRLKRCIAIAKELKDSHVFRN